MTLDQLKQSVRAPLWYSLKMQKKKGQTFFLVSVADYPVDDNYMGFKELEEFLGV